MSEDPKPTARQRRTKANLNKVFPTSMRQRLSEERRCFLACSLDSPNFAKQDRFMACIRWIAANFDECIVFIGDSVYRLTLGVTQDLHGPLARRRALQAGVDFTEQYRALVSEHSGACRFTFKNASALELDPRFPGYHATVRAVYEGAPGFRALVDGFAESYVARVHGPIVDDVLFAVKTQLARDYLLEESALFTCLAEDRWRVLVYPGSNHFFEQIAEGHHPEAPAPLQGMIWATLRLRR